MAVPEYVTDCPTCGRELTHFVGSWDHAPWLCGGCAYAFWPAQLTPAARLAWRPAYSDHCGDREKGWAFHHEVMTACLNDRDDARARATSVLPEFVTRLTTAQLRSLIALLTPRAQLLNGAFVLLQAAQAALKSTGV